jgi:hypothetical protein
VISDLATTLWYDSYTNRNPHHKIRATLPQAALALLAPYKFDDIAQVTIEVSDHIVLDNISGPDGPTFL